MEEIVWNTPLLLQWRTSFNATYVNEKSAFMADDECSMDFKSPIMPNTHWNKWSFKFEGVKRLSQVK